jgi:membrane-associated protein
VFPQASGVPIVCALLFLEEAGLPIPIAPGDAVLVGAGILVASGAAPVWLMAPLAYLAVIGGVLTGYAWAHRIGPKRVHALAARLHAAGPYDRAAARLRSATPLQIAASRLLPGLRVYTSLVAGAVGLNLGRFMTGVLPASVLWVVTFMGLGLFVGAPVQRLFGSFEAYGLQAAVVAVVVVIWVVAARWIPAAKPVAADAGRATWRLALAFVIDLFAITCVAGALILFTHVAGGDSDNLGFLAAIFAMLGVVYLGVARQTVGFTLGESVLDVRYRRPRRARLHLPC